MGTGTALELIRHGDATLRFSIGPGKFSDCLCGRGRIESRFFLAHCTVLPHSSFDYGALATKSLMDFLGLQYSQVRFSSVDGLTMSLPRCFAPRA
jgi:hypothetical protein